jgi:hypothetical protein
MSTLSRYPGGAGKDNTGRILTHETQNKAYAAAIALATTAARTLVVVAQLTGALALTIGVGNALPDSVPPMAGDELTILFSCDATSRTVSFGAGFQVSGNLVLAISKYGSISFRFNGTTWIEVARAATA